MLSMTLRRGTLFAAAVVSMASFGGGGGPKEPTLRPAPVAELAKGAGDEVVLGPDDPTPSPFLYKAGPPHTVFHGGDESARWDANGLDRCEKEPGALPGGTRAGAIQEMLNRSWSPQTLVLAKINAESRPRFLGGGARYFHCYRIDYVAYSGQLAHLEAKVEGEAKVEVLASLPPPSSGFTEVIPDGTVASDDAGPWRNRGIIVVQDGSDEGPYYADGCVVAKAGVAGTRAKALAKLKAIAAAAGATHVYIDAVEEPHRLPDGRFFQCYGMAATPLRAGGAR